MAKIEDPEKRKLFTILVSLYLLSPGTHLDMDDVIEVLANFDKKEEIMQTVTNKIRAEERVISLREGEQRGELKGVRSTILDQLVAKFEQIPMGFTNKLNTIDDIGTLKGLSVSLIKAESLEAFLTTVDKVTKPTVQ